MRKFIVLLLSVIVLFVSCSTTNVIYDIHQPLLEEYLSSPVETASVYAKGQKELSKPERIRIGWKDEGKDEYIFLLSTSEDFRSAREYRTKTNYVELENLFTGKPTTGGLRVLLPPAPSRLPETPRESSTSTASQTYAT